MEITGKTKLTGLIGTPVAHSVSPQMHNEAFRQLNLDYVYLAFDLAEHRSWYCRITDFRQSVQKVLM